MKKLGYMMILLLATFSLFNERGVSGDESETSECTVKGLMIGKNLIPKKIEQENTDKSLL